MTAEMSAREWKERWGNCAVVVDVVREGGAEEVMEGHVGRGA